MLSIVGCSVLRKYCMDGSFTAEIESLLLIYVKY